MDPSPTGGLDIGGADLPDRRRHRRGIRWQATSPGLASIGAALEALIVGAAVIVALVAGGLLLVLGQRTVGQMLLMPAVAAAVLTTVGAATGPTFVAAQQWPGEVVLTLTSPPGGTISATATCDTPENSTAVRHIAATSIGYLAVAGVLAWLPAGWELSLFRPGVDPEAEAQRVDTAVVTRLSDADDDAVHQRLVGAFPFSYGTVEVVAEWECAA
jgi:hypothetical protein